MRYLLFILTVFLPAAFAMAQDPLQGAAELPIYKAPGEIYKAPDGMPGIPKETDPSLGRTFNFASNTTARVETSAAPNVAKSGQTSFLMDAGVQYADEGDYAEAEQAYLRALANDPGNPDVRFRLSTLYIMMKRYREAADILNALAVEFPGNAMTHNNLAWIYATGGEMKNGKLALRHAREAILSGPTQPPLWNTLAEAYYVAGQYDEALRASECAIDLLKTQNAPESTVATFEEQHTKILRAQQAYKRMLGIDDKK